MESFRISGAAARGAGLLGFDESDILACVCALDTSSFHKSMESAKAKGYWQDVYKPTYGGIEVYVKVQIVEIVPHEVVVIIQFKHR